MVSTPKRPPGRPRSERRKPKGPSPVRPEDQTRHDHLVAVSKFVRENGHADWADTIDHVMSPLGPAFVERIQPEPTGTSSLTIRIMHKSVKEAIVAAAKKEAKKTGTTHNAVINAVVEKGMADWLDGTFDLRLQGKAPKGQGTTDMQTVLSCYPNAALHAKVAKRCRDMKAAGEFTPGRVVYVSTVALHSLYRHFEMGPYAPGTDDTENGTAG